MCKGPTTKETTLSHFSNFQVKKQQLHTSLKSKFHTKWETFPWFTNFTKCVLCLPVGWQEGYTSAYTHVCRVRQWYRQTWCPIVAGWMEVVLDRRMMQDDWRGLGEGISDNTPTPSKFVILLEKRDKPIAKVTLTGKLLLCFGSFRWNGQWDLTMLETAIFLCVCVHLTCSTRSAH